MTKEVKRLLEIFTTLFIIVFPSVEASNGSFRSTYMQKYEEIKYPENSIWRSNCITSGNEVCMHFSTFRMAFLFFFTVPQKNFFPWASCHLCSLLEGVKLSANSMSLLSRKLTVLLYVSTCEWLMSSQLLWHPHLHQFDDWTHAHTTSEWNLANGVYK